MIARALAPAFVLSFALVASAGAADDDGLDGLTPLHEAARDSDVAAVEALLDAGADPNAPTVEGGFTPLHVAAWGTVNPAVVEALLDAGADPTAKSTKGVTPFDLVKYNEALRGTSVYWRLHEARFQ